MNDEKLYNVQAIQELCGLKSPQAVIQWVQRNLEKLNADGEHVHKQGKCWLFDSVAVERIQELRNTGSRLQAMALENETIDRLEEEKQELQAKLAQAQKVITEHFVNVASLQNTIINNSNLLTEAKTKEVEARAGADLLREKLKLVEAQLEEAKAANIALTGKIEKLEAELSFLQAERLKLTADRSRLEAELQAEQSKGFLTKLFG